MSDGDTEAVLAYLAGLNGERPLRAPTASVREAITRAERLLTAVQALDLEAVTTLMSASRLRPADLALLVHVAARFGTSQRQREAAQAKNARARQFVLQQWAKRPELDTTKAAFARQYVPVLRRKFGTRITAETIARDWLPPGRDYEPAAMPSRTPSNPSMAAVAWTGRPFVPRKR